MALKPTETTKRTTIDIQTTVTVARTGRIEAVATVLSHGNAIFRKIGKLVHSPDGWHTENLDGQMLFAGKTRKEVVDQFARLLTADAARWSA